MNESTLLLLRAILTALALASFLGIVFWAYSRRARAGFEEAERLPFEDEEDAASTQPIKKGDTP